MVSLSNESRRSGTVVNLLTGYFFNEDTAINHHDEDELTPDTLPLSSEFDPPFRKLPTVFAIVLHLIVVILLQISIIVLPIKCPKKDCGTEATSIIAYIHGALWFVHLALDRYYRHHHNKSRQNGYLEFYRRTRHIRRIPLNVNSCANAVVLVLLRILDDLCPKSEKCLELMKTKKFNDTKAPPDVAQDEMLTSFMHSSASSEIGYRVTDERNTFTKTGEEKQFDDQCLQYFDYILLFCRDDQYTDQVLEKQADMIRYLKHHNVQLGKRILALSAENNALKSNQK
ncbi:hypothetical protein KUTeg_006332, partial [Tegillarca granosa]